MSHPVHPASSDVDAERGLAEETSRALGKAGHGLQAALEAYRAAAAAGLTEREERAHLDRIARRLYALLVQRECAGARHGNLEVIRAVYDVPEGAVRRL